MSCHPVDRCPVPLSPLTLLQALEERHRQLRAAADGAGPTAGGPAPHVTTQQLYSAVNAQAAVAAAQAARLEVLTQQCEAVSARLRVLAGGLAVGCVKEQATGQTAGGPGASPHPGTLHLLCWTMGWCVA